MVMNRALVAAVCVVLFAGAPARADGEKPQPEQFAVLPVVGIAPDEAVAVVQKLGHTKVVRVPLFRAVLVWGTDEELADVRWMLRPL